MADPAKGPQRRGQGYGRMEAARVREDWSAGVAPTCPRCGDPLESTPVPPRADVAYVRDRILLHCTPCGGSAAVEQRDRSRRPPSPLQSPTRSLTDPLPDPVPRPADLSRVGWREWILLPDHAPRRIKVKVDTGARTSALHAESMESVEVDGAPHLRFQVCPSQRSRRGIFQVVAPLVDERSIRSSSGAAEHRPVVLLRIALGNRAFETEVTLTRRDQMGFRMLLGRTALHHRFLVDPSASFLQGDPVLAAASPPPPPRT